MCIRPSQKFDQVEAFFVRKYDTLDALYAQLVDVDSHLYSMIKSKALLIYRNTMSNMGIKLDPIFELDELYMLAVHDTARQVRKNKKKWMMQLGEKNALEKINLIRGRVVSNIRNLFDEKRKGNIRNQVSKIEDIASSDFFAQKHVENEQNLIVEDLIKLSLSDKSTVIKHLENLIDTYDISLSEAEELCDRIELDYTILNIKSNLNCDMWKNDDGQLKWDMSSLEGDVSHEI